MVQTICLIDGTTHTSPQALTSYLRKNFGLTPQAYYDTYVTGTSAVKCFFCNDQAAFISAGRGYKRICDSTACIAKSRATGSIEGVMYKHECSNEEAVILQAKEANARGQAIKAGLHKAQDADPDFFLKKSAGNTLFWTSRGHDAEEAESLSSSHMDKVHRGNIKAFTKSDERKEKQTTSIRYWIDKGLSLSDAKEALRARQRTFSKDRCLKTLGDVVGHARWTERQDKWRNTLVQNNSLIGGFSKISQQLFNRLLVEYPAARQDDVYYASKNHEHWVWSRKADNSRQGYQLDFTDMLTRKAIEFNGTVYHADPRYFSSLETPHPFNKQITAAEQWRKDAERLAVIQDRGYEVLVIWEADYARDPAGSVSRCLDFLGLRP